MTPYRSLLERLTDLADHLPPSHVVGDRPADRLTSALVHFVEFGDKILDAADADSQHVQDDLAKSPDQRSVARNVVDVLCEPFPTPRTQEETSANQDAKIAALQAQVDQLLASRADLPTQTAAGAEIPQTTVSTTDPVGPSQPLTAQTPLDEQEPDIPGDAPAPAPVQADSLPTDLPPSVPDDVPAPPRDPSNS